VNKTVYQTQLYLPNALQDLIVLAEILRILLSRVKLAFLVREPETSLQLLARLELIKIFQVKKNVNHAMLDIIVPLKVYLLELKIAPMDFIARPVLLTDNITRALLAQLVMVKMLKKPQIVHLARQVALVHIKAIRQLLLVHFLFAHLEYTALLMETQSIFLMEFPVNLAITVQQAQKPMLQALQQLLNLLNVHKARTTTSQVLSSKSTANSAKLDLTVRD